MAHFATAEAHRALLRSIAALPRGFRVGTTQAAFNAPTNTAQSLSMTLTALLLDKPTTSFAAVLTQNALVGAPITLTKRRLAQSGVLSGIIVNNKVANVAAPDGVSAAEQVCEAAAKALGLNDEQLLSLSTGVVGWPLPVPEMAAAMPTLASAARDGKLDALDAATGIMTTDQWPKVRSVVLPGGATVVGIAKGAGMIEPNMATMLSFVLTDARVSRETLQGALETAVNATGSFNSCSIDSDTSPSDAVVALSSNMANAAAFPDEADGETLTSALTEVCRGLADDVVRNGEGVRHVMRVRIVGAGTDGVARAVGKACVNSPLLKCAVAADDANVGRLAVAVGRACMQAGVALDTQRLRIAIGGTVVMERGSIVATPEAEQAVSEHMAHAALTADGPQSVRWPVHSRCVEIALDLGDSSGEAVVLGADLTHEYVSINADYRT